MELLIPTGLAYWIMGDGSMHNKGLHLSVYAFSSEELNLLIKVLEHKFGLYCSIHNLFSIGINLEFIFDKNLRTNLDFM